MQRVSVCASVHLETKIIQHSGVILRDLNYSSVKITEIVFQVEAYF